MASVLDPLLARLPGMKGPAWTPVQRVRAAVSAGIIVAAGAFGWALAEAVSVSIDLAMDSGPPPAPVQTAAAPPRVQPLSTFDPIFTSNVFHARRSNAGEGAAPSGPVRLTLTGTFRIGGAAFALIVGPDGRTEDVYRVGDCVPRDATATAAAQNAAPSAPPPRLSTACGAGQGRLASVERSQITVTFGGRPTVIAMQADRPAQESNPPAPVAVTPGAAGSNAPFGQTRTGNTVEVHIPSVEVEKSFENFSEIVRQALVVPFTKDGATVGFQIQRIQPGSVFQRIGLQNLDVIRGVNGQPITTADQALRLFTLFRNERHVVLDVDRGQENLQLSYIIE
jgi:hypothetical protein